MPIPAVGLIVVGALTIFACILGLVQLPQIDAQLDDMIQQAENDPKVPAAQKQKQVEIAEPDFREMYRRVGRLAYGRSLGRFAIIVLVGGLQL